MLERITLIITMLRSGKAPVNRLELATAEVAAYIPQEKTTVLREVYKVAREEERFKLGAVDASHKVFIEKRDDSQFTDDSSPSVRSSSTTIIDGLPRPLCNTIRMPQRSKSAMNIHSLEMTASKSPVRGTRRLSDYEVQEDTDRDDVSQHKRQKTGRTDEHSLLVPSETMNMTQDQQRLPGPHNNMVEMYPPLYYFHQNVASDQQQMMYQFQANQQPPQMNNLPQSHMTNIKFHVRQPSNSEVITKTEPMDNHNDQIEQQQQQQQQHQQQQSMQSQPFYIWPSDYPLPSYPSTAYTIQHDQQHEQKSQTHSLQQSHDHSQTENQLHHQYSAPPNNLSVFDALRPHFNHTHQQEQQNHHLPLPMTTSSSAATLPLPSAVPFAPVAPSVSNMRQTPQRGGKTHYNHSSPYLPTPLRFGMTPGSIGRYPAGHLTFSEFLNSPLSHAPRDADGEDDRDDSPQEPEDDTGSPKAGGA